LIDLPDQDYDHEEKKDEKLSAVLYSQKFIEGNKTINTIHTNELSYYIIFD